MKNCTILFKPINKSIEVVRGTSLLEAARQAGIFIDAPCGGKGHCGKCRVKIKEGNHKFEYTPILTPEELDQGIRLACHTWIEDSMVVEVEEIDVINDIMVEDITSESKSGYLVKRAMEIVKKSGIKIENSFKTVRVKLPEPNLDDNLPDWERLQRELEPILGTDIYCPIKLIRKLPRILRASEYDISLVLHHRREGYEILNIVANKDAKMYGLNVDIGTTTVAACLVNLHTGEIETSANSGNLQMQFGGDVINRIIYSTKEKGLEKLQESIVEGTINQLIKKMTKKLNIENNDIVCSVFAGNTTMTHLFLGVFAENIRLEPYIPAFKSTPFIIAEDISIEINPKAPVYLLPNVASYVGGDIVSGVLAAGFWDTDETTLFLDLGTNGEIVLGNREWMVTCACSAGPAFEGGEISCGMRATAGAIDKITIDKNTLKPIFRVIGNKKPKGLCGSGLIDLISEMFLSGIIDRRGKLSPSPKFDRIRYNDNIGCHEYVIVSGKNTDDGRDITINEVDIDNFLRAKGAVYSGIRTLLNSVGLDATNIDRVTIAGGIGQNLNIENSIVLGLLPDISKEKFDFIGNSSLTGAYICLISDEARMKADEISNMMTYIELSVDPGYMEEFVSACFLPHTDIGLFPSLKSVINI